MERVNWRRKEGWSTDEMVVVSWWEVVGRRGEGSLRRRRRTVARRSWPTRWENSW